MNHATTFAEQTTGEAEHRLSPLEAFVQWVANVLRLITGMKRRKTFPRNWKDHWQGLRELEWYRDQILAFSAKHVLSGGSLNDRTDFRLIKDIPVDYGVCPATPHAMNQRFIAMAQFRFNPSTYIHRHIRRIARAAGIALTVSSNGCPLRLASRATSPGFADGALPLSSPAVSSLADRRGRWRVRSCARVAGGGRGCPLQNHARAPPTCPHNRQPPPRCLTRENAHACAQSRTSLPPTSMTTRANILRLKWQAITWLAPARR